ncbi:MAG TPA: MFS transporter [Chloroflexota bacterium]|nr:MFS transporter [Chloroflexota bacterium]
MMRRATAHLADVTPLRESADFRRLWLGGALSGMGSRMKAVAVAVQIYALTHSSLAVGLEGLFIAVPLIAVGLLGSSLVDAVDRRRLVIGTGSALAIVSLLFAAQAYLNLGVAGLLYALVAVQSSLVAIDQPARRTFAPRLLAPERLTSASALSFLSFQVSMIVGPLFAGVLIAASGYQIVYAVDAATFLTALYPVFRLPPMPVLGRHTSGGFGAVLGGLSYVVHQPVLRSLLLADLNGMVFGMPWALFPALAATRYGGVQTVGWLYAAPAFGGLLAAAFSGRVSRVRRQGMAVLISIGVWGAAVAAFGFSSSLMPAVLMLAIAGGADVVNGVFRTTILQLAPPDALRGRVNAVGYVVGAGGPQVGNIEAGIVASLTSAVISAISGGVACVIGVGIIAVTMPALGRYRPEALEEPRDVVAAATALEALEVGESTD